MKLLLIFSLCFLLIRLSDGAPPCGDWEPFKDDTCFKILDSLANYPEAERLCSAQDGETELVTIGSAERQSFLETFIFTTKKNVDNVWLGAYYQGEHFYWEDGSNLTYSNWATGSPKNRADYCIMMHSEDELKGKWADESCQRKNLVVCQKTPSISLEGLKEAVNNLQNKYQKTLAEQTALNSQLKSELSKMKVHLSGSSIPLGFVYVQLPKEKAPSDIWPSMTWTEVSATYAGVFFRVDGGGAAQFGDVQQGNAPKLTQVGNYFCQSAPTNECGSKYGTPLTIHPDGSWSDYIFTGAYLYSTAGISGTPLKRDEFLRFQHSTGEVRPVNMAVKVWKRTA